MGNKIPDEEYTEIRNQFTRFRILDILEKLLEQLASENTTKEKNG